MNNEPIQFLPVKRFWEHQPSGLDAANIFFGGFAVGCAVTVVVFVLSAWFLKS